MIYESNLSHDVVEECHDGDASVWVSVLQFGENFGCEIMLALFHRHCLDFFELCVVEKQRVFSSQARRVGSHLGGGLGARIRLQ